MLRYIREKSEGWFAWTIVIAICVTFVLWGIHSYFYSNQLNNAIASVNNVKISQQQFQSFYRQLKRQQQLQNSSIKQSDEQLKQFALESLITSLTLTQAANQEGFRVGDNLAEISLLKMPVFQENGLFSKRRFEQVTNSLSMPLNEFLSDLKNNILVNQIRTGLITTAFVLPNETDHFVRLLQQTRQFDYAILSKNRYLSSAKPTEQDIAQYYQNHKADFQIPEKVSIDYVLLSLTDLMKTVKVTDQDLKTYGQNNLSVHTQSKQWKKDQLAQSYRQQKAEQQFSSLLDQLSNLAYENPGSLEPVAKQLGLTIQQTGLFAQTGGTEPITQNPKVLSAAFDTEVLQGGNNSEPINLNDSTVMILRIHDHQLATVKPLTAVKDVITAQLEEDMAKNQAKADADNAVKSLNMSLDSLDKNTQHYRLEWKKQPYVTRYGSKLDNAILETVFRFPKDKSILFADVQLSNGDMAVVHLIDIKEKPLKKEDSLYSIFSRQFESGFGLLDYQLYVMGQMATAKINRVKDISASTHVEN